MKISLVGFGLSNKELFKRVKDDHELFVSETRRLSDEERKLLDEIDFEERHSRRILDADLIVVSPGVSPSSEVGRMILSSEVPHTTEVGASFDLLDLDYGAVIAVTGTNGKTTTSEMITHVLRKLGRRVFLGGNNGNPLARLSERVGFIVLELSSFQLFWVDDIPVDVGVILNVSHDHEDWHGSFEDYLKSKLRLAKFSKKLVVGKDLKGFIDAEVFGEIDIDRIPNHLKSSQNIENVSATVAALEILGYGESEVLEALSDFKIPPHRMEFVAEIGGVRFYDDSKATNIHAVMKAIENFDPSEVVLIISGILKEDPGKFKDVLKKLKGFVVLGERMGKRLGLEYVEDIEEAVRKAFEIAKGEGVVLFSPGGASFDMFENYVERGKRFKEAVRRLRR